MIEIIIFIIIIIAISKKTKQNQNTNHRRTPPVVVPPASKASSKSVLPQASVTKQVNKQIFGTENPKDKVTIYNRLILTDQYQDMEKMAHELGISKYRVLREVQDLKAQGHYPEVEIDEKNYRLIYPSSMRAPAKKERTAAPKPAPVKASVPAAPKPPVQEEKEEERTFVEPSKPYRPTHNAGERYEEWMEVPSGKVVVHCNYCGADNLIPKNASSRNFTCYFCREEL